jgi:predicted amidophosphoribosyltransferase
MTYDNYKLSNPQDDGWTSDDVTSCCGCSQTSTLIDDEIVSVCDDCGEAYPSMIEPYEYEERQREKYEEMKGDY